MMIPWTQFSWVKTTNKMRSLEARSANTPMGQVLWRTSRSRRSMALLARVGNTGGATHLGLDREVAPCQKFKL